MDRIEYPFLLCNIGSGVGYILVTSETTWERVSGTSLGGGTFYGLCHMLTGLSSFDQMLDGAEEGDNCNVDLTVGDIYGGDYCKFGLKASTIASSFGKAITWTHAPRPPASMLASGAAAAGGPAEAGPEPEETRKFRRSVLADAAVAPRQGQQHGGGAGAAGRGRGAEGEAAASGVDDDEEEVQDGEGEEGGPGSMQLLVAEDAGSFGHVAIGGPAARRSRACRLPTPGSDLPRSQSRSSPEQATGAFPLSNGASTITVGSAVTIVPYSTQGGGSHASGAGAPTASAGGAGLSIRAAPAGSGVAAGYGAGQATPLHPSSRPVRTEYSGDMGAETGSETGSLSSAGGHGGSGGRRQQQTEQPAGGRAGQQQPLQQRNPPVEEEASGVSRERRQPRCGDRDCQRRSLEAAWRCERFQPCSGLHRNLRASVEALKLNRAARPLPPHGQPDEQPGLPAAGGI
jgi:hypothetical protein